MHVDVAQPSLVAPNNRLELGLTAVGILLEHAKYQLFRVRGLSACIAHGMHQPRVAEGGNRDEDHMAILTAGFATSVRGSYQ